MSHPQFSKADAEEKLKRTVEALFNFRDIPRGTRGKVVMTDRTPQGYEVAIEWEMPLTAAPFRPTRTWINRKEYEEMLVEI